jgi:hypothetical protein
MGTRCRIATSCARRIFRMVSGHHDHLPALGHAHPGDDTGAGSLALVLIVRHQQAELEPRRAGIQQSLHPLAGRELALLVHSGDPSGAAAFLQLGGQPAILLAELPQAALFRLG